MLKTRLSPRTQPRHCVRARVKAQSHNYQLDANGSLLRDGLRSYEFDAANRLGNVTTGVGSDAPTPRYVHNALGQRLFKTEPLYAPVSSGSNPADPGVMQTLANFFASLWGGSTNTAAPSASEKLGYTYYYDEDGSLLYELGSGGANSGGSAHYVYLPTPAGPMPMATYTGSKHYAVHTDHLNTPRRLTNSAKQVVWQWAFSAFGDEQPTLARNRFVDPANTPNAGTTTVAEVTFNLRYPGQYYDKESGLNYNYFRSYDPKTGRYSQSDPIGLDGGWNKFVYAENNPLMFTDPEGLNPALACYRAGKLGWEIGQAINPYVQPLIASALDSVLLNASANSSSAAAERQTDYARAKNFCDMPPPPGGNDCSTLSRQIDHAAEVIRRYEAWDLKWSPGRHAEKINSWKNRLQNLKDEHNQKCTQCR